MKRSYLSFLMCIISMWAVLPSAFGATAATTYSLKYTFENGEACVVQTNSPASRNYTGTIIVPDSAYYNGKMYPVTGIGNKAFYTYKLDSIILPRTLRYIKLHAFENCNNLKSIVIPEGMEKIDDRAFRYSSITSLTLPSTIRELGDIAQQTKISDIHVPDISTWCSVILNDFNLPDNWNLYVGDSLIEHLEIPENTPCINPFVFAVCRSIRSVKIPASLDSISYYAFYYCPNLESVEIPESSRLTSIGNYAFYKCPNLESAVIPEDSRLTSIGIAAFHGCSQLRTMQLPESLREIGEEALSDTKLTELTIPSGMTSINGCAFLNDVTLNIKDTNVLYSFVGSYRKLNILLNGEPITEITIPEGTESFNSIVFREMNSLTSVKFPESVKEIGDYAFSDCSSLTDVVLPTGELKVGMYAFSNTAISSIDISNMSEISDGIFSGCSSLTDVVLPTGKFKVGKYAFAHTAIPSFDLSNMSEIGDGAFGGCLNLKSVEWNDIPIIPASVFSGCSNLEYVTIPKTVTTAMGGAFAGCNIKEVHIEDLYAWCKIDFQGGVGAISNIIHISASCGSNPLNAGGSLILNGEEIRHLVIPDSLDRINKYTFCCGNFEKVTFGKNIKNILTGAFAKCRNLTSLELPDSLSVIDIYAFQDCSGLKTVTIPKTVNHIWECAFEGCENIDTVRISDLEAWCNINFGVGNLHDDGLHPNPLSYGAHLILNGGEITDLKIPESIRTILPYAFDGGKYITSITLHEAIESVRYKAFTQTGISTITLPASSSYIEHAVFESCPNLREIIVEFKDSPNTSGYLLGKDESVYDSVTLYVPAGTKEWYASKWTLFKNIVEIVPEAAKSAVMNEDAGNAAESAIDLWGRANAQNGIRIIRKKDGSTIKVWGK